MTYKILGYGYHPHDPEVAPTRLPAYDLYHLSSYDEAMEILTSDTGSETDEGLILFFEILKERRM